MTKTYYAEYCPYGFNVLSDGDRLVAFDSKEERDQYAEEKWEYVNALTSKEAVTRYGKSAVEAAKLYKGESVDTKLYGVERPF